jgi:hypothetical protein
MARVGVSQGGNNLVLVLLANRALPNELLDILVHTRPIKVSFSPVNNIVTLNGLLRDWSE